jgi:stearoyl-CoA desaturase (Delta-9 desaturase)
VGAVLAWNSIFRVSDLVVLLGGWFVAATGVTIGYHRLLAHRAFETHRPLRFMWVAFGAMAGQGPPITWAAHHRRHHRLADKEGDPHSPYANEEPGVRGALKGLWHAHLGWLFDRDLESDPIRYCPDLTRDRDMRFISKHFGYFVAAGLLIPGVIGLAITQTWVGFATGVLWGGIVRWFVGNHITYAINSIGHYFGSRRFPTPDESRNVTWLAIPSFGEAWHNNHHAFPRSYRHGMRWYEIDVSAGLIRLMEWMGLAWNVVRIPHEVQERRAKAPTRGGRKALSAPAVPLAERPKVATGTPVDVE